MQTHTPTPTDGLARLSGKAAVVTGGSRGVGLAIATRLAAEGMAVALLARTAADVHTAAAAITAAGGQALALTADVADAVAVQAAITQAATVFGRLDLLVNNAGTVARGEVEQLDPARWQRVLATNLTGAFLCAQAAFPHLKRQGGWIINISSGLGKRGKASQAAYCASKFGLMGLAQSLAAEGLPYGIRVSTICPGAIATAFGRPRGQPARLQRGIAYLQPEDVADAVLALLAQSPRAWTQEMNLWAVPG